LVGVRSQRGQGTRPRREVAARPGRAHTGWFSPFRWSIAVDIETVIGVRVDFGIGICVDAVVEIDDVAIHHAGVRGGRVDLIGCWPLHLGAVTGSAVSGGVC
jgi:hypothetical protein